MRNPDAALSKILRLLRHPVYEASKNIARQFYLRTATCSVKIVRIVIAVVIMARSGLATECKPKKGGEPRVGI